MPSCGKMRWIIILLLIIIGIVETVKAIVLMYEYLTFPLDPIMSHYISHEIIESAIILLFISQFLIMLSDEEGTDWD